MSKTTTKATGKPLPVKGKSKINTGQKFATAPTAAPGATLRVNANIRPELHRKLKIYAAAQGVSMGDLIEEWIESLPTITT